MLWRSNDKEFMGVVMGIQPAQNKVYQPSPAYSPPGHMLPMRPAPQAGSSPDYMVHF